MQVGLDSCLHQPTKSIIVGSLIPSALLYYKENAMTFERYLLKSKSERVNDTKV